MVLSGGNLRLGHYYFPAAIWRFVFALANAAVVMVDGVLVLFVEFLEAHFASELLLPPVQRLFIR